MSDTKLLDQAIAKLRALPQARQDELAEVLMSLVEQDPEAVFLSPSQQREVARRLENAKQSYATDDEVDAVYTKLGA